MSVVIAIVLALFGIGVDDDFNVDAQIIACRMAGGYAHIASGGYQTLAACRDSRGWEIPCPNSHHSYRYLEGCYMPVEMPEVR